MQWNDLDQTAFISAFGDLFEHRPEIAAQAWCDRPFERPEALYHALCQQVIQLSPSAQHSLICAHPDLGARIKMAPDSVKEQASLGLDSLTPERYERFQSLNQTYKDRFNFPFIIAVRNHNLDSILSAFKKRVQNAITTEHQQAILEILQIAKFRLEDRLGIKLQSVNQPLKINTLTINSDRLLQKVHDLAQIGRLDNGGVCRLAFSPEDVAARELVQEWMRSAGMMVRIDAAGNIIGRYPGLYNWGALSTGSHIDTVPVGGRYDGALGVLAGIEIVQCLNETKSYLNHPIEVIVFTDEERSVIGSKAMAGHISSNPATYARLDGTSIQDCLRRIGGNWDKIHQAQRGLGEIAAFIELHVEQGGVLETKNCPIGLVTGIVGQRRFAVKILGRMNHAGTTPMNMRQDALLAAAKLVVAVNQIAIAKPGDQVATVGYLTVVPNATNTIAGEVDLRIDLRDLDEDNLEALIAEIYRAIAEIAAETYTQITCEETLNLKPTLANAKVMDAIAKVSTAAALDYLELPSRAGHDAQEIGRFAPMGMIFIPSQRGISHSELEYTAPEECIQGINTLLNTFLHLDAEYRTKGWK
jgi:beta-ureidopropionase / N-carbamoyl-L-amino-acid hydrolase